MNKYTHLQVPTKVVFFIVAVRVFVCVAFIKSDDFSGVSVRTI